MKPADRLALSERVISGWEAIGGPGGRLADSIRMCREEMLILVGIGDEKPALKARADEVIGRYQQLVLSMKLVH